MPTISGTVTDRQGNGLEKYITVQDRATLTYIAKTLSVAGSGGAYSVTVPDTSEYIVSAFDEAPAAYNDPDAANTKLLLTMQGTNGSTTYTDSSANNFTVTRQLGTGTITTAITPHSDISCASFPNDTRLVLPNTTALDQASSGPWIVETWARFSDLNDSHIFATPNNTQFRIWSATQISFRNGNNSFEHIVTSSTIPTATWVHLLWSKHTDDKIRIYLDGIIQGAASASTDTGVLVLKLGTIGEGNGGYINGYLQDFRIKFGSSVSANFTPPTSFYNEGLEDGGSGEAAQIFDRVTPVA